MRRVILGLVIFCLGAPALAVMEGGAIDFSQAVRFPVEKFQLKNGLTVLLHHDSSIPMVTYQSWFRVGSKDEEPGYTGIAHLFEHMMFKGANRYSNKEFDRVLRANGATNNAFTTRDYTAYYINLPKDKVELAVDLESDRMESLQINAANLASEREVVKEERRFRVDNSVMGQLYQSIFSNAFKVHPYRWPVIGWMKDLNRITVEKCREFFRKYYAPNNAVIVVAGDFDSKKMRKLIEKYYGHIPSQEIVRRKIPMEPKQTGSRQIVLNKNVQSNYMALSYHAPEAGHEDVYPLDLLAGILGDGSSSRLYRRLVYSSQLASRVSAYALTPGDPGLFQVIAVLKPGADYEKARKIVYGELWRARNRSYSEKELQKAKNQVMKSYVDGLKTISGKANALALNEILLNSYEHLFSDLARYNRVTLADLQRVAKKYLQPTGRSVVRVQPKSPQGE